jgi:hypothetical protein
LKFFDEVDVLQRLQAGPIPEEIWIPLSSQDVQAYFKNIALPKTADDEHRGKLIARKNCPCHLPSHFENLNKCVLFSPLKINYQSKSKTRQGNANVKKKNETTWFRSGLLDFGFRIHQSNIGTLTTRTREGGTWLWWTSVQPKTQMIVCWALGKSNI